jgi:hypothetical protein
METLEGTLYQRIDELIEAHKGEKLLSVTASRAAIDELAARTEGLEKAIREVALEITKLAASQKD